MQTAETFANLLLLQCVVCGPYIFTLHFNFRENNDDV